MREYLFRGKRLDNGEWAYGIPLYDMADCSLQKQGQCQCSHGGELIAFFAWMDDLHEYGEVEVDPGTVGQYIWMNDKNAVKIFEGDIVSVMDEWGEIYRFLVSFGICGGVANVKHQVGYMGFYFSPANRETAHSMESGLRNDLIYWLNSYDCEVIGNIRDNPELTLPKKGTDSE